MANKKMTIGLFSGSIDKLTGLGVIAGGAAADDIDVEIFVLMQGARAFLKDIAGDPAKLELAENPHLKDEFLSSLDRLNVTPWIDAIKEARELVSIKVYVCGLAGKVWGGEETSDFIDLVDDICGIGEYITSMEESDINLFI